MSEEKSTNSNKLDLEAKRQSSTIEDNRESYKAISEDFGLDHGMYYPI